MRDFSSARPEPLSTTEKTVVALAWLTVVTTTWAFSGKIAWAPPVFLSLASLTLIVSLISTRIERLRINWMALMPLALLILLVGVSLLNPSHDPVEGGKKGWIPRSVWITWLPSTVDRQATLTGMMPWLAAFALGGALRQATLSRRAVRILWALLLANGVILALTGAYFAFMYYDQILGLIKALSNYHFASFPYRNHWAAYAILLMGIGLGFAFSGVRAWLRENKRLDHALPGIVATLLIAVTIPIPGSRSGTVMASLLIATSFIIFIILLQKQGRKSDKNNRIKGLILLGFVSAILVGGLTLSWDRVQEHWARTQYQLRTAYKTGGDELRLNLTRDTVRMAMDRPVWGWGLGTYGIVFPRYQGTYLRDDKGAINARVVHAHNDWAHLWAETGVLGLLLLCFPIYYLGKQGWRSGSMLFRWGLVGCGMIAIYALAEFPYHNPAVLLLWVTLLSTSAPSQVKPLPRIKQ